MKELLSTAVAIAILIVAFVQIFRECQKQKKNLIYITALVLIFGTVTLISAGDRIYPIIIKTDTISEWDIMGKGNIAFKTTLKIVDPINLKIKDTYSNLGLQVDYACVDKFVFINYQFGDNEKRDNEIRKRGFKFTYKARASLWSKEYKEYENWLKNTGELKKQKEKELKK